MKAWYSVATWRFQNVTLSLGYGTDRMNGLFGGISWNVAPWLTLKAEYSPMDYILDQAGRRKPHPDEAKEKYNIDYQELSDAIIEALAEYVRVRDVEVALTEKKIYVAYENYGHSSHAEAMARVLAVTAAVSPHVDAAFLVPRVRGIPVVCAEFPGEVLFRIRGRDMTNESLWQETRFTWAEKNFFAALGKKENVLFHSKRSLRNRARNDLKAMVVYEPRVDRTLDDDYQNRWSVDLVYEHRSSNGWAALTEVRFPLWSDVDIPWEPWMNENIRRARVYSRDGRWWFGARVAATRDRDPMSFAGMAEGRIGYGIWWYDDADANPWRGAAWLQTGYHFSGLGLDVELDYGRFLDADMGVKLSLIRRWDDVAVGFWISRTDRLAPDKNFTNAGVHLELPAERWLGSWFGKPSARVWEQDVSLLSTWRFDAGREPAVWRSPDHLLSQLRPIELKKNVRKLLEEYCAFEYGGDGH